MFKGNIIDINFNIIKTSLNEVSEPKIILMNEATLMIFMEEANNNPNITITETEFDQIYNYCNVPISLNQSLQFGEVIVK